VPRHESINGRVRALVLDLEDGQDWDDLVTVTLRRDEWHTVLVAGTNLLRDTKEGIDAALIEAKEGNPLAALVGPHLVDTAKLTQDAMRGITRVVLPLMMQEVDAIDAAEDAYNKAKSR
jgi:hypothetical protein